MEPAHIRFGGGAAETVLYPWVAVAMVVAIALILLLPKKYVLVPLLLGVFTIPMNQVVVVGGLHFTALRFLVLAGCVRLVRAKLSSQKQVLACGFTSVDRVFTLWACSSALTFTLLWMEAGALIQRLGFLVDALGGYFVLRFLIHTDEDVRRAIKLFALIAVIMAVGMTDEQLTRQNIFGLVGGSQTAGVREGHVRSQGVFQHPLLAGTFGATCLPLFVGLWKTGKSRTVCVSGAFAAIVMVVTSFSSTPIMTFMAGIVGLCFWPLRERMRIIRWGFVTALVGLQIIMKASVWALIDRVDITGSSSSYHRYMLVDNFIRHFGDWWLLGVKNYNNWGWDMWDLSNQYAFYGLQGGLVTLVFFIAIIAWSFRKLGRARRLARGSKQEWFLWCLGVDLFAHTVAYFGISYFDQTQVAWFALLAIISQATLQARRPTHVGIKAGQGTDPVSNAGITATWKLPGDIVSAGSSPTHNLSIGPSGRSIL